MNRVISLRNSFLFLLALIISLIDPVSGLAPDLIAAPNLADSSRPRLLNHTPGEIIVGLEPGFRWVDLDLRVDSFSIRGSRPLVDASAVQQGGEQILVLVPPGQEEEAIAHISAYPGVRYAEPNGLVIATADESPVLPADRLYLEQQWGLQRIDASRAWAYGLGSNTVRVAIIDTGVDLGHPEFRGRIIGGRNYVSPGALPQDDAGHGTLVAGIIAGNIDDGSIVGVAPRVLIDPRKTLNDQRQGTISNLALAIRESADAGAQIINMSLQTPQPSQTLEDAVNYAAGKGIVLIASVGNNAPAPVGWPAAYPAVIGVGASTRSDELAFYSNRGDGVALVAPGGSSSNLIVSAWPAGIFCSSAPAAGTCRASGTSMSAAFVSGAAALLLGNHPHMTPVTLRNALLQSARDIGLQPTEMGAGRLDLRAATKRALQASFVATPSAIEPLLTEQSGPVLYTLSLENPSSDPLFWQIGTNLPEWIRVGTTTVQGSTSGSVSWGKPATLSVTILPDALDSGRYTALIPLTATGSTGTRFTLGVPVNVTVQEKLERIHLPLASQRPVPLIWRQPDAQGATLQTLSDDSSIGLLLPFQFPLVGGSTNSIRLYSDGFMTFSASEIVSNQPVACLPDDSAAGQALYGWWTDLDPSAGGAVSVFRSGDGAFVIEFNEVPLLGNIGSPATFQMALLADGTTQLSYRSLPENGRALVGMEVNSSLLYREIYCGTVSIQRGQRPETGFTYTIRGSDLR